MWLVRCAPPRAPQEESKAERTGARIHEEGQQEQEEEETQQVEEQEEERPAVQFEDVR